MHIPWARLTRAAGQAGRFGAALTVSVLTLAGRAAAQTPREIPVYPGAQLAESEECCEFTTTDPLARVLAFYEPRLHATPLTSEAYVTRHPALRPQWEQVRRQMPASVELRVFELGPEVGETFSVVASPGATTFHVTPEQLGVGGARWGLEFRKRTNQLTHADSEYLSWFDRPPANQQDYDLPVYPGSLATSRDEATKGRCVNAVLVTTDPFDRVVAFYQQRLLGQLKADENNGASGEPFRFGDRRWGVEYGGESSSS
jgi:hypothetical protein